VALGCGAPPPSQFPSAQAALDRMHATYACSRGIQGEAKVDYYGEQGRVRGSVTFTLALPQQLRFEVTSPFGVMLSSLTSNAEQFALFDLQHRQFLHGPASTCNVARFTRVPVPPSALVQLLRGEAPVLVHEAGSASVAWESGTYVVRIDAVHDAHEQIFLQPTPEDWARPWSEQRVRVLEVRVQQQGIELYRAELGGHRAARTAPPRRDPDGFGADLPPSGPACAAEVPRSVRLLVPDSDQDLLLLIRQVSHNPPLVRGVFEQATPGGVAVRYASCED
jgi:hypothetical protein